MNHMKVLCPCLSGGSSDALMSLRKTLLHENGKGTIDAALSPPES